MTLVFDQTQAAAVYSATRNTRAPAFVSPFVGRWDDRGFQGVDLIKNIVDMYHAFDTQRGTTTKHVEVLAASVRTMDHFYASIAYGADIITAPLATFQKWVAEGRQEPATFNPTNTALTPLGYQNIRYANDFTTYKINDEKEGLLYQGLTKFAQDWNGVVER
jgi:transaldolase